MNIVQKAHDVLEEEKSTSLVHAKHLNNLVSITSVILILFGGIVYYWVTFPFNVLVFKDDGKETHTLKVLNKDKTVPVAGYLEVQLNYCKRINVPGKVKVEMVGITKPILDWPDDKSDIGCINNTTLPIKMPTVISFEPRHLEFTVDYKVNPFRTVTERFDTEEFKFATPEGQVR